MTTSMFYVFPLYYNIKIMIVLYPEFIVYYDKIYEFRFICGIRTFFITFMIF